MRGSDPYQVAVGPIHAGVIESGHFRFHVVGDRILHLDAQLFYKHRGLECAAVGASGEEGLRYATRACAACCVTNAVAYAQAVEQASGLRPTSELARVRTILLELERVWSHLNDIAAVCAGVGFAAGNNRFAGLTERARRLNAALTGHRFLFGSVRVAGSALAIDARGVAMARDELASILEEARSAWRELLFNASFQDRLPDVGVLAAPDAARLGTVGPAARAAGVAEDARSAAGDRLAYDDFAPVAPRRAAGDVQARLEQRALELPQSVDLLQRLLDGPVGPASTTPDGPACDLGVGRVESPRGATVCVVEQRTAPDPPAPAPHRLLCELARRRARGTGQPVARLPAHQQELRALLRLRGSLMLTLLRDLRQLRRDIALPRSGRGRSLAVRHVDAGSCNGCEHELTLASSPYYDLQRYGLGVVASPRHADVLLVTGAVTSRMRVPLLTAYNAMPEPRMVAALGDCALGCDILGTSANVLGAVETSSPSTSASPAARRPPTPSRQHSST